MPAWADSLAPGFWTAGLAVIPLAVVVAAICRLTPLRPATRHALWVLLLAWFVVPVIVPLPWLPDLPPAARPAGDAAAASPDAGRATPREIANGQPVRRSEAAPGREELMTVSAAPVESPRTPAAPDPRELRSEARPAATRSPTAPITASRPQHTIRTEPRLPGLLAPAAGSGGSPANASARRPDTTVEPRPAARAMNAIRDAAATSEDGRRTGPSNRPPGRERIVSAAPERAVGERLPGIGQSAPTTAAAEVARAQPDWLMALNGVRAAVVQLPRLPVWTWLLGVAAVLLGCGLSTLRFAGLLRGAQRAPRDVRGEVSAAAATIGLRSAPDAYLVDARISPLIWCGPRPRLILPRQLWQELDGVGRNAVLCHELAHLRRGDHWVRWGELLICAVYWWHPLAWWVRRRISEEAENCCDAWVTWLLPHGRRAYAEALLHANEFTNRSQHAAAPMGLGVLSGRAKRMARRITMVMTHSTKPGLSGAGVTLAFTLALLGWSATPLWACPKKPKATTKAPAAITFFAPQAIVAPAPPATPASPGAPPTPAPPALPGVPAPTGAHVGTWTTSGVAAPTPTVIAVPPAALYAGDGESFRAYVARTPRPHAAPVAVIAGGSARGDDELEERLAALERQLQQLHDQLRALHPRRGAAEPGAAADAEADAQAAVIAELESAAAAAADGQHRRALEHALAAQEREAARADRAREREERAAARGSGRGGASAGRAARLPAGKLQALAELLVREDVPLRVRPGDDEIEVLGTPAQQRAVDDFIGLINESPVEWRDYAISAGKREALWALMARSDVPIFVRQSEGGIGFQATPRQHEAILAFLREIEPDVRGRGSNDADAERRAADVERQLRSREEQRSREKEKSKKEGKDNPGKSRKDAERTRAAAPAAGHESPVSRAASAWLTGIAPQSPFALVNAAASDWPSTLLAEQALFASAAVDFELARESSGAATVRQNAIAMADQMRGRADALSAQADGLFEQLTNLQARAESTTTSAELFQAQAELFAEKADDLEERAAELTDAARVPAAESAAAMRDQAVGIEAQVRVMESNLAELGPQIAELEADIESLRQMAEALRATADELLERFAGAQSR